MTEEEARHLAERIIATWPAGAKHYIWKSVLLPLEHHTADVTYRIMRDNATSTPTPGAFLLSYRSQRARLIETPALFADNDDEPIGRNEYLARHPPATVHELNHWTRTTLKEQP